MVPLESSHSERDAGAQRRRGAEQNTFVRQGWHAQSEAMGVAFPRASLTHRW